MEESFRAVTPRLSALRRQAHASGAAGPLLLLVVLACWRATACAAASELQSLIVLARDNSPAIAAATQVVAQAEAALDGSRAFFDPVLLGAAGWSDNGRAIPAVSGLGFLASDAIAMQAGVEVPVSPGLYAGAGAAESYLRDPPAGEDRRFQTVAGVQVRVPLGQDRGHRRWHLDQERAHLARDAALRRYEGALQDVRHAVEQQYFAVLEASANAAVAASATERARQLLKDAEELFRLEVVPEYQLAPARSDLAQRRQQEAAAHQIFETARLRLAQVVGTAVPAEAALDPGLLIRLADRTALPDNCPTGGIQARGVWADAQKQIEIAGVDVERARDDLKPDLSLRARSTWSLADSSSAFADSSAESATGNGGDIVLVWQYTWGQREQRARVRGLDARREELRAVRRQIETGLRADLASARGEFGRARDRLGLAAEAELQARRTLDAEIERFRLGEGRSRNVLDAQNDLANALQAHNAIAGQLLRAWSDFLFSMGYHGVDVDALLDTMYGGAKNADR